MACLRALAVAFLPLLPQSCYFLSLFYKSLAPGQFLSHGWVGKHTSFEVSPGSGQNWGSNSFQKHAWALPEAPAGRLALLLALQSAIVNMFLVPILNSRKKNLLGFNLKFVYLPCKLLLKLDIASPMASWSLTYLDFGACIVGVAQMLQHLLTNISSAGEYGFHCSVLNYSSVCPKAYSSDIFIYKDLYTHMKTWVFCNVGMCILLHFRDTYLYFIIRLPYLHSRQITEL